MNRKKSYDLQNFRNEKDEISHSQSESTVDLIERGNWSNPVEFILSCLNYAVGLGDFHI